VERWRVYAFSIERYIPFDRVLLDVRCDLMRYGHMCNDTRGQRGGGVYVNQCWWLARVKLVVLRYYVIFVRVLAVSAFAPFIML
jgi:hypothetical protein